MRNGNLISEKLSRCIGWCLRLNESENKLYCHHDDLHRISLAFCGCFNMVKSEWDKKNEGAKFYYFRSFKVQLLKIN